MSRELYSQVIGPLNKGVNQQADSFVLPGFAKVLENANCDLVEGLKKRLGSVPLRQIDNLTQNAGGQTLTAPLKWDEAWLFVYNRSTTERFVLMAVDDSRTITRTGNTTNNSNVVASLSSATDVFVGATVTGTGIPANTIISSIEGTTITLSNNATATNTGTTLTITSSLTFVTGVSNVEPITGTIPSVLPAEQTFTNITTANLNYLRGSGRAKDRLRATSFQDFVFITNIQQTVAFDATETLTRFNISEISNEFRPTRAQVNVKLVDYDTIYTVRVTLDNGNVIIGNHLTPSLTDNSGNTNFVSTETIAAKLISNTDTIGGSTSIGSPTITSVSAADIGKVHQGELVSGTGVPANTFVGTVGDTSFDLVDSAGAAVNATANGSTTLTLGEGLDQTDINNELNFERQNSQILITCANATRFIQNIVVSDARGNTLMDGFSNQVTSITELPSSDWQGYTVVVTPDGTSNQSSYYLQFNAEGTTTNGDYGR
jgi:hypothetical protein